MRPLGRTLVAFLLTLTFAYILGVIVQTILNGGDVVQAIVNDAWRVLFTGGFVAGGLFLLFLLLVNIAGRKRGSGSLFWINSGMLIIAIVLGTAITVAAGVFVGALAAGFGWLSTLGAFLAAGELFVGGVIALAITHFAVFRREQAPLTAP
ncbi:MAG: hypothetical protein ABIR17_00050 [Pseudolysinimonas sp.]|uniref:hypothetical protein n=1 Tax=Pseudolysinimonas sp. TaxID=2680009 RepID=UPI0032635DB0